MNESGEGVISARASFGVSFKATASLDTRFTFVSGFLRGAQLLAESASEVEELGESAEASQVTRHNAFVIGAIVQAAMALEAETSMIVLHGPGHHLGSNGVDKEARDFLNRLEGVLNRESRVVERYQLLLHLLGREPMDSGTEPFQSAALLMRLRNELVHFKSKWGQDMEEEKLFKGLEALRLQPPPWSLAGQNFFPHRCLGAACANWAARSANDLLVGFYKRLGLANPYCP